MRRSAHQHRAARALQSVLVIALALSLLESSGSLATPREIALPPLGGSAVEQPLQRPQLAQDLAGLDPSEGGFSKGLRGSFVVKHYVSGPWKGGTAVVEVASDFSYAEIRIFDQEGALQRIYSIQPKSEKTRINPAHITNPLKMVEQVNADDAAQNPAYSNTSVSRSRVREAAVEEQTARAVQAEQEEQAAAYSRRSGSAAPPVQGEIFAPVTQLRPGTVAGAQGEIREPASSAGAASEAVPQKAPAETRRVVKVRRKRHRKHPKNSLDTPLSGPPPEADEYYYEEVVVTDKKTGSATSTSSSVKSAESKPRPSAEPVRVAQSVEPKPRPPAEPVQVAQNPAPGPSSRGSGTESYDESNLPDVNQAIKETESERKQRAAGENAPLENAGESAGASTKRMPLASDSWKPQAAPAAPPSDQELGLTQPSPSGRSARGSDRSGSEEMQVASAQPMPLASDSWSPKAGGRNPTDAELGLTPLPSARTTGRTRPPSNPDELVPMSEQAKEGNQVEASESWSPSAGTTKLSAQEEREQAMLNSLKPVVKPVVKVKRDVYTPDEGVRPFYSLEKYSGAQYGRHREFERRVIYKQNKKSAVQGYDFYIDEVDRKQEKHYLYYYKIDPKTKKAVLIATEKHEKVSFLSNYDVGSEDKGKIVRE